MKNSLKRYSIVLLASFLVVSALVIWVWAAWCPEAPNCGPCQYQCECWCCTKTCPTCQHCVGGSCQPITCPTCQHCVGGSCQPITCPTCQHCVSGVCTSCGDDCCNGTCCPTGQICCNGACAPECTLTAEDSTCNIGHGTICEGCGASGGCSGVGYRLAYSGRGDRSCAGCMAHCSPNSKQVLCYTKYECAITTVYWPNSACTTFVIGGTPTLWPSCKVGYLASTCYPCIQTNFVLGRHYIYQDSCS